MNRPGCICAGIIFIVMALWAGPVFAAISEEAAVTIAKAYMRNNGYENNYVLFWPSVTDDYNYKNFWHITFPPSVTNFLEGRFAYSVDVDKTTGEVLSGQPKE